MQSQVEAYNRLSTDNTLDDFIADFKLMFNNAKIFNDDASIVYKDTITMEQAFDAKVAELTGQAPNGHSAPSQAPYGYAQQPQQQQAYAGQPYGAQPYGAPSYGAQPYQAQAYQNQQYQQPSRVNAVINSDDEEDED